MLLCFLNTKCTTEHQTSQQARQRPATDKYFFRVLYGFKQSHIKAGASNTTVSAPCTPGEEGPHYCPGQPNVPAIPSPTGGCVDWLPGTTNTYDLKPHHIDLLTCVLYLLCMSIGHAAKHAATLFTFPRCPVRVFPLQPKLIAIQHQTATATCCRQKQHVMNFPSCAQNCKITVRQRSIDDELPQKRKKKQNR
ncbi:hypothetical protein BaRGS_00027497 [Batillaria attramentaria]|uniref:Uncharacterized protein n=1 Tax=Batillaria attramentaria TaxID=370345 RepID=A0ABD0K1I7_9CAEN